MHPIPEQRSTKPSCSWLAQRLPFFAVCQQHLRAYMVPKNLNAWYVFGLLALLVLALQVLTGVILVMHYKPDAAKAFQSVEFLMRDVPLGWLMRYMHSTGASMFFVVVYLHIVRGFLYGSYRKPRELVWLLGMALLFCLMAEAFMGYLLPWGQMSYWAAQVITSALEVIPKIGPELALLARGDYSVSDATLGRFFALHVIAVPMLFCALAFLHVQALHAVGSSNPSGREQTKVPFYPYFLVRDVFAAVLFLLVFFAIVFFAPEMGGYFLEPNNFMPADPLRTPEHIAPMWYFSPFYAMLRACTVGFWGVDAKAWGALVSLSSVGVLCGLPWLDRSPVPVLSLRPLWHKLLFLVLALVVLGLGVLGLRPLSALETTWAQACTVFYFLFFLSMPWWSAKGHAQRGLLP